LLNQISDHQQAIALTRQAIAGQLDKAGWREALKPLLVAIEARSGEAAGGMTMGDIAGGIDRSIIAGRDINQTVNNVVLLLGQYGRGEPAGAKAKAIADLALQQMAATNPFIARGYREKPADYEVPLSDALSQLLEDDPGLAARLDVLLKQYETAGEQSQPATIDGVGAVAQGPGATAVAATGGSVAVGGPVAGDVITGGSKTGDVTSQGGGRAGERRNEVKIRLIQNSLSLTGNRVWKQGQTRGA
jgi:hypothetical protein